MRLKEQVERKRCPSVPVGEVVFGYRVMILSPLGDR